MFSQKADAGWPGFGRLRSNSKSGWSTYRSRSPSGRRLYKINGMLVMVPAIRETHAHTAVRLTARSVVIGSFAEVGTPYGQTAPGAGHRKTFRSSVARRCHQRMI